MEKKGFLEGEKGIKELICILYLGGVKRLLNVGDMVLVFFCCGREKVCLWLFFALFVGVCDWELEKGNKLLFGKVNMGLEFQLNDFVGRFI